MLLSFLKKVDIKKTDVRKVDIRKCDVVQLGFRASLSGWLTFLSQASLLLTRVSQSISLDQAKVVTLAASVLTTGAVLLLRDAALLQPLELMVFDQMVRMQSRSQPDPRLLLVAVTESDLTAQGQWPIADATLAEAIAILQKNNPSVIGLDLYRNLPHPPGHDALRRQLQADNLIVITKLADEADEGVPPPPNIPAERIGFNDFVVDPDNIIRRNFVYAYVGEKRFYSFGLLLALRYFQDQGLTFELSPQHFQIGETVFQPLKRNSGGYEAIDTVGWQLLVDYRAKDIVEEVTLSDILRGNFNPAQVRDRIILIGSTGHSILEDNFSTPHSAAAKATPNWPGVLIHAQLTHQLLTTVLDQKPLFWFWPEWGEMLWIWAWTGVGAALVWRIQNPLRLWLASSVTWGGMVGITALLLWRLGWIPLVSPSLALLATIVTVLAYKSLYVSVYDSLTGLPNRSRFLHVLRERTLVTPPPVSPSSNSKLGKPSAKSSETKPSKDIAVLFLGLDRFNVINDTLGYRVGDRLLQTVRDRLQQTIPPSSFLARVGGDEFAVLLEGSLTPKGVEQLADQLQTAIKAPIPVGDRDISISSSIGITFAQADYRYQPEDLLRNAHTALYRAKALGKARYEVFAVGMQIQMARRLRIETDLRQALQHRELKLNYQPIVHLPTGKLAGFEALCRWYHPQQGFISPAEFVGIAEETDLIFPLGHWVLEEACRQLQTWQSRFHTELPLMINVNLSSKQFTQADLVASVKQVLEQTGLEGRYLKLEITESIAMDNIDTSIDTLLGLKNLNLQLSIDDFGIGYSSLSYLCSFPVDTLKVDRSFVSRMENSDADRAIVQTIITLSHALGMNVTAEGIEKPEQRQMLENFNCEYGQGYFFAKPLSAEEATALLDQGKQW